MRRQIVAGNWKMNGDRAFVKELVRALGEQATACERIVFPPSIYLALARECLAGAATKVEIGAQHCHGEAKGAFTGELAPEMLKDIGCSHCLVGHSERRSLFGLTEASIAAILEGLRRAAVVPMLCIGETLEQRESGATEGVLATQLESLAKSGIAVNREELVLAYEPVWAIGTGRSATPDQAQETHAFIRGWMGEAFGEEGQGVSILYGGSVKPANAADLLGQADIDGALVGGASLKADDFLAICQAAKTN